MELCVGVSRHTNHLGALPLSKYERYLAASTTTNHYYVTQNGEVVRETIEIDGVTRVLDYIYDESGRPSSLIYTNGSADPITYYYVLNLQGDVEQIIDADGTVIVQYTYDPWGRILSITDSDGASVNDTHIAKLNGLRYRGYHGDNETQWYYLQSRYYDPFTRRFVNADSITYTGQGILGANMFAYCGNNPVAYEDSSGNYYRPAVAAVNDGGSGLSSTELKYLTEILSLDQTVTSADDEYFSVGSSMSITKNLLNVDVNGFVHFILDYQTLIGIGISAASIALPPVAGFVVGTLSAIVPSAVDDIVYGGMPVLDDGMYVVYELDMAVSSTVVESGGYQYLVESHKVRNYYVLISPNTKPSNYLTITESYYATDKIIW